MGYTLGIDLGTTFSAAAIGRHGRAEILGLGTDSAAIPSVVLLRADGQILVGEAAERRAITEPARTAREFKRRLGDPVPLLLGGTPYGAEALMARLLRAIVDLAAEREGDPPDRIVVTHPASYGPYKKDLLAEMARLAEVGPVTFLTEPEAAAISYSERDRLDVGQTVAVYDLGGGTFDAAVLRKTASGFELLGQPEGIERLGGIDFDQAIFAHVGDSLGGLLEDLDSSEVGVRSGLARLRADCRDAKEGLSGDTEATIPVLLPNIQTEVRLTRAEFEAMVRPRIDETIAALQRVIQSTGLELEQVDRILLVGGSARIPLIAEVVHRATGRPVALDADPKLAVALGAASHGLSLLSSTTTPSWPAGSSQLPPAGNSPPLADDPDPGAPSSPGLAPALEDAAGRRGSRAKNSGAGRRRPPWAATVGAVVVVGAAAGGVGLLAAGARGPSLPPESPSSPSVSSAPPTLVASTSPAPGGLRGSLSIGDFFVTGSSEQKAYSEIVAAVREANPGLTLTTVWLDGDAVPTFGEPGESAPDLVLARAEGLPDKVLQGHLLPLDSLAAGRLEAFSRLSIDGCTVGGSIYCIPESIKAVGMIYNRATIAEPPATTEELLEGVASGRIRAGFAAGSYYTFGFWAAFGGRLMDDAGRCVADQTGVDGAFDFFLQLSRAGARIDPGYAPPTDAFRDGQLDLVIDGPWVADALRSAAGDRLAVARLPAGPAGPARPFVGVDGWFVNPRSANHELAVETALLISTRYEQRLVDAAVHIPAITAATIADPVTRGFAEAASDGSPTPQVKELDGFWSSFDVALESVLAGGADPAAAVAQACSAMDAANGR